MLFDLDRLLHMKSSWPYCLHSDSSTIGFSIFMDLSSAALDLKFFRPRRIASRFSRVLNSIITPLPSVWHLSKSFGLTTSPVRERRSAIDLLSAALLVTGPMFFTSSCRRLRYCALLVACRSTSSRRLARDLQCSASLSFDERRVATEASARLSRSVTALKLVAMLSRAVTRESWRKWYSRMSFFPREDSWVRVRSDPDSSSDWRAAMLSVVLSTAFWVVGGLDMVLWRCRLIHSRRLIRLALDRRREDFAQPRTSLFYARNSFDFGLSETVTYCNRFL